MRSGVDGRAFPVAVVVYLATAWCSTGFFSADEFHQIIPFAQWKLSALHADALPWEFADRIRSSLLPWMAAAMIRAGEFLALSPFSTAFLLRGITALAALASLRRFHRAAAPSLPPTLQAAFAWLSYGLWFLPFLAARFSGETWAMIALLNALAAIFQREQRRHWAATTGFWLALMACFRPAMLPAVAGLGVWALVFLKPGGKALLQAFLAALATWGACLLVDSCFYGSPIFGLARYLAVVLPGDPDHAFVAFPWWYYAPWVLKHALPPIGACLLLATVLHVAFRWRSPVTWCTLPVLLALALVPHKELRFLFPLAGLAPWLLVTAWADLRARGLTTAWRSIARMLLPLLALVNVAALAVVVLSPADAGREPLAKAIRQRAADRPARIIYLADGDLPWAVRIPRFYLPAHCLEAHATDPCMPLPTADTLLFLIADRPPTTCTEPGRARWSPLLRVPSRWNSAAQKAYLWEDAQDPWTLYEARP